MSENKEDKIRQFIIPENYNDSNQLFGSILPFKVRNIVEAGCVSIFLYFLIDVLPFVALADMVLKITFILTFGILFIVGIKDESVIQFLTAYIKYRKRQRVLHLRRVGYVDKRTRTIAAKDKELEDRRRAKEERDKQREEERRNKQEEKLARREAKRSRKAEAKEERRLRKEAERQESENQEE